MSVTLRLLTLLHREFATTDGVVNLTGRFLTLTPRPLQVVLFVESMVGCVFSVQFTVVVRLEHEAVVTFTSVRFPVSLTCTVVFALTTAVEVSDVLVVTVVQWVELCRAQRVVRSVGVLGVAVDHLKLTTSKRLTGLRRNNAHLVIRRIVGQAHAGPVTQCVAHLRLRKASAHHGTSLSLSLQTHRALCAGGLRLILLADDGVEHLDECIIASVEEVAVALCVHDCEEEVCAGIGLPNAVE